MKKNSLFLSLGIIILFIIVISGLVYYNIKNNTEFFETSFSTVMSMVIAVVVSYYFVQKKTDNRRKKEKVDKLLYKIQEVIIDENFLSVENEEIIRKNLILHRSIANKLKYVNDNIDDSFNEDMKKISETFEKLREFYGDHFNDSDYIKKSVKEITNFKSIIDDNCDNIHMKLI